MGVIIITVIAGILFCNDVISTNCFVTSVLISIAWIYIGAGLYFKFGLFKFWYHDVLHWHTPDDSPQTFDGCSQHARCKYCGKDIMQDSQGNWFT